MVVRAAVEPTTKRWTRQETRKSARRFCSSGETLMTSLFPSVANSRVNRCMTADVARFEGEFKCELSRSVPTHRKGKLCNEAKDAGLFDRPSIMGYIFLFG